MNAVKVYEITIERCWLELRLKQIKFPHGHLSFNALFTRACKYAGHMRKAKIIAKE